MLGSSSDGQFILLWRNVQVWPFITRRVIWVSIQQHMEGPTTIVAPYLVMGQEQYLV